jgi:hypothetical protein
MSIFASCSSHLTRMLQPFPYSCSLACGDGNAQGAKRHTAIS